MSWAARDGPEDSDDDSDDEEGFDEDWGDGGGGTLSTAHRRGGRAGAGNSAANDWFAATRHGRDDTVLGGTQFSFGKGPGWEDTFAFKRSTARRAIQTSRILAGKVSLVAKSRPARVGNTSKPFRSTLEELLNYVENGGRQVTGLGFAYSALK